MEWVRFLTFTELQNRGTLWQEREKLNQEKNRGNLDIQMMTRFDKGVAFLFPFHMQGCSKAVITDLVALMNK